MKFYISGSSQWPVWNANIKLTLETAESETSTPAENQQTAEVETATPPEDQETADTANIPDAQLRTIQLNNQVQRKRAADGHLEQAERMVKRSHLKHVPGNPGDNVTIPIPFGDHGKDDPRNIMGAIVDR